MVMSDCSDESNKWPWTRWAESWEEGEIGKKIRRIRNDKNFMAVRGQVT